MDFAVPMKRASRVHLWAETYPRNLTLSMPHDKSGCARISSLCTRANRLDVFQKTAAWVTLRRISFWLSRCQQSQTLHEVTRIINLDI
jgi:hypothetical protein